MKADFEIITFDCYGTLIDWESGIIAAFQSQAEREGLNLDAKQIIAAYMSEEPLVESAGYRPYREVLAETARRVAARLGWQIESNRADFLAESLAKWKPFSDTGPALDRLAQHFKLGILSNIDNDLLAESLGHFNVTFDFVITAEQVKSYKPAPAHFLMSLNLAGGRRLLHAAQSYFHDVVPARKLGIPVAWINRKGERAEKSAIKPTYEFSQLLDLAEFLT
jgi:2-haloalkanoic acid dehalogenase type II